LELLQKRRSRRLAADGKERLHTGPDLLEVSHVERRERCVWDGLVVSELALAALKRESS
jgi:hypothetical protein